MTSATKDKTISDLPLNALVLTEVNISVFSKYFWAVQIFFFFSWLLNVLSGCYTVGHPSSKSLLLNLFFCQFVEDQAAQKDELPPKPELYFSLFILFVFGKYLYRDSF